MFESLMFGTEQFYIVGFSGLYICSIYSIFLRRSPKDLLTQPELDIVSRQKNNNSRENYFNAI